MTSEESVASSRPATPATDETAAASPAMGKPRGKAHGAKIFFRDLVIIFVAAVIISVGIKTFLIRSFYIPSASMENTLQIDDRILVNELVPNLVAVQRGDVVVFRDPGGWLPPQVEQPRDPFSSAVDWVLTVIGLSASDSEDHLIKRVIGLPGDTVECCDDFGHITINGGAIEEPYLKLPDKVTRASQDDFSVTVPEGKLWVLGDNRNNSCDSRCNATGPSQGFVPLDHVVGRAFIITWPSDRWGWLDNYPTVFDGVDEASGAGEG